MTTQITTATCNDDHEMQLPGFRFHPTDEELVGFYLRRKVDKKPLRIELIKQIDIYKHDPWDLPKINTTADKEGYFFCKRGRKYRNSVRPNRVTGSGFWKATGIDKQVYSAGGESRDCIGLKKTLVYYRGSAGKGTKTDWMMHEFRLPSKEENNGNTNAKSTLQEAEVWTICRIFKRNVSSRKYTPEWRESSSTTKRYSMESTSKTCAMEYSNNDLPESYISFEAPVVRQTNKLRPFVVDHQVNESVNNQLPMQEQFSCTMVQSPTMASSSSFQNPYGNDQWFTYENWDELRSVVEFALDSSLP